MRGAYEHFGRAAAEFARMPVMAERIDELVSSEGHEYLFDAVKSGRGAMLATAHIGNWEYSACWLAHHGLPINSLGADQRDERITELIKDLRRAGGAKALGKANDLKAMIKALQRGEVIAVPIDQDAKEAGDERPRRRAVRQKHPDEHRRPQRRHIRGHKGAPGAVDVDVPALGVGGARNLQ